MKVGEVGGEGGEEGLLEGEDGRDWRWDSCDKIDSCIFSVDVRSRWLRRTLSACTLLEKSRKGERGRGGEEVREEGQGRAGR